MKYFRGENTFNNSTEAEDRTSVCYRNDKSRRLQLLESIDRLFLKTNFRWVS